MSAASDNLLVDKGILWSKLILAGGKKLAIFRLTVLVKEDTIDSVRNSGMEIVKDFTFSE